VNESLECSGSDFYPLGKALVDAGVSFRLQVRGWSMYPFIRDGDCVEVVPVSADDVCVGDVVLSRTGRQLFAHRVIRRIPGEQKVELITRGDNHFHEERPVDSAADLIGRIQTVYRGCRMIRLDRGLRGYLGKLVAQSGIARFCVWWAGRIWKRGEDLVRQFGRSNTQQDKPQS
jgi:hypothetical protein